MSKHANPQSPLEARRYRGPKLGGNRAHARARLPTSSSGPWLARRSGQAIPRNPARHCATVSYAGFFQTSPTAEVAAADARGTQVLSTEAVLYSTPAEAAQALSELKSAAASCPASPVVSATRLANLAPARSTGGDLGPRDLRRGRKGLVALRDLAISATWYAKNGVNIP